MAKKEVMQPKRGWIALSRDIDRHWIWLDARRFQMWIQMLLWAQYQDGVIPFGKRLIHLKRGQFLTTLNVLAGYMRCSKQTVLTFLRVLESSQMIKREKQAKFTIITIVNYDKYQPSGMTENRSSEDVENEQIFDPTLDRELDPIKEYNNKEKNLYIQTREKNLEFYQEIRDSDDFWKKTSEALSIPMIRLKDHAEKFFDELMAKEDFRDNQQEIRTYLFNWLRKEFLREAGEKKYPTKKRTTDGTTETDNRRGVDAPTPSAETLSKGIF